jgi:hypothetical protein
VQISRRVVPDRKQCFFECCVCVCVCFFFVASLFVRLTQWNVQFRFFSSVFFCVKLLLLLLFFCW